MKRGASRPSRRWGGAGQSKAFSREIMLVPHLSSPRWEGRVRWAQQLAAVYTVSTPAWELPHQRFRCRRAEDCPLPRGSRAGSVSLPRRGQRPLPFPLRIEDELPLVSAAGLRGPGLRTEGRGQGAGEREPGAMAGPVVGVAGACFAQGHGGAWDVGRDRRR